MSDQTVAWIVSFTMKDERQFRYLVKDSATAREVIDRVAREAQIGRPIASFHYGLDGEQTGAIQVDEIESVTSLQAVRE